MLHLVKIIWEFLTIKAELYPTKEFECIVAQGDKMGHH